MKKVTNTRVTIEKAMDAINDRYDLRVSDANDIREMSSGSFDMICNSFIFGYAQGFKAAKAEMKAASGFKS